MCAAIAGPVNLAKVSFQWSVLPLSVALNKPCAAASLTTCLGTSCPDDRAAVHTVVRVAASASAARASAQTAPAASAVTSFLTFSSFAGLPAHLLISCNGSSSPMPRRRFAPAASRGLHSRARRCRRVGGGRVHCQGAAAARGRALRGGEDRGDLALHKPLSVSAL